MAPEIENALPPQWRLLFQIVTLPVYWIPNVQAKILGFIWDYSSSPEAALKFMLFLLPALHVIVGMWCTMTAVYTLPFRGGRKQFVAVVLSTWWDSGRSIGLYWAGILRAMFLTAGYVWGFIRIFAAGVYLAIVELITLPFSLLKQVTKKSLRPGIPWIAVALTIFWCILEGGAFSFTLFPLFADIVSVYVGAGSLPYLQPILFVFLVLLIAGSFAALDAMVEAIQKRNVPDVVKTVVVEAFVMFFEVLFLYRELVDAITPVLAHQSGGQVRIGLTGVLLISSMAWIGIRGMTWFLFARYGTPTLRAIISGQGLTEAHTEAHPAPEAVLSWTKEMIGHVKRDIGWFQSAGMQLLEAYVLPPLQVIAATINFFMLLFAGRHMFQMPLKTLHTFMETGEILKMARAEGHTSGRASGR